MNEENRVCPFVENCPMYEHFSSEGMKRLFILQFCESRYYDCERFKLNRAGEEVPEKLLPDGDFLK